MEKFKYLLRNHRSKYLKTTTTIRNKQTNKTPGNVSGVILHYQPLTEKTWHFVEAVTLRIYKTRSWWGGSRVNPFIQLYPVHRVAILVYSGKIIRCAQSNTFLLNTKLSENWFYQMCVIICEVLKPSYHCPWSFSKNKNHAQLLVGWERIFVG